MTAARTDLDAWIGTTGGAQAAIERAAAARAERERRAREAERAEARAADAERVLAKQAEDAFVALFQSGDASMGKHGQGLEPAGGGVFHGGNTEAWDGGLLTDNPSSRLHRTMRDFRHRIGLRTRARAVELWWELGPDEQQVVQLAYEPPHVYRNRVTCRRCAGMGAKLREASFGRYEGEKCKTCNGVGLVENPDEVRIREAFRHRVTEVVVVECGKTVMRKDAQGQETRDPLTVEMTSTSLTSLVLRTRAVAASYRLFEGQHDNVVTLRPERVLLEAFLGWEASQAGEKHEQIIDDAMGEATEALHEALRPAVRALAKRREARRARIGLAENP